ncbi:MAG TPA: MaoC family dehydratase [Ferrovibrio sp.]|jgi:2-methylfumaryl-CoA hydratase|uniref:MaoC family dehydratase n=1 Tax=Ferrovibrio sp. TaxID=1917215 RepID=UPI002B4ACD45|nr:MaoC family dehydratase [Ferrovibrio sp.]HLT79102.1 MaoC family dehydratase [Ferrovibrio sp.]
MSKTNPGNYFEDFRLDQELRHPTPRTVTQGDVALYTALYGPRFAVQSADSFAKAIGLKSAPVDDLLAFHVVFGKTVPDVSLNAVANLGYAQCRFLAPVFAGDTLHTVSRVIGLKENSNRKTGVVYVRSIGYRGEQPVLDYVRWVMVRKRDESAVTGEEQVPKLGERVAPEELCIPAGLDCSRYDWQLAGSPHAWEDYQPGEKIDHVDGMTIEEAEHMLATRLYQNTAKVHFDQFRQGQEKLGRRLIYGGHVISLARALSFNGLANACFVAAINGGRHVNPTLAGHTIYAWSEVLEKAELAGRRDLGALRLRTLALKDQPAAGFPDRDEAGKYPDSVVLDLDYWVLMPRRA